MVSAGEETYSDVIVDTLGPAIEIDEPINSSEFASEEFLTLGVPHRLDSSDVVYRHNAIWTCE